MNLTESRPVRRTICFLLVWGVIVIVVLQLQKLFVLDQTVSSSYGGLGGVLEEPIISGVFYQQRPSQRDASSTAVQQLERLMTSIPKTDKPLHVSDDDIMKNVQNMLPNLPVAYWNKYRNNNNQKGKNNETCARFPSIYDIEFNNVYWQTLTTVNGTFHLYAAYYDVRKLSRIGPAVRILGVINRIEPTVRTYCQFWFDNHREPVVVRTMEYKYIWYKKWGNYRQGIFQPYLIACQIPKLYHGSVPVSVSLTEKICDTASNNLKITYNSLEAAGKRSKDGFAVCVKGLDFLYSDLSVRLVEWIELLNELGADKIFFYRLNVHPNISKVLDYYRALDRVDVTDLTLPGGQPNVPGFQHLYLTKKINHKRQNELIPYNDCLYRNLYRYEYIVLLDVDEVIVPIKTRNWKQLMRRVLRQALTEKNETRASYNVRNVYFLDDFIHSHGWFRDIPSYMHMMQHVYRSKNYTKPNQYVKCFHNPERALTLHNHFPLACLSQGCTSYAVKTDEAQLQHYRADCVKTLKNSCTEYRKTSIFDTTIWRYKDRVIENTLTVLKNLDFL